MGMIENHLDQITSALGDIEVHLKKATNAEERVMSTEGKKREKMIGRVIDEAEELIKTCDAYFSIVQKKALAIENID